MEGVGLGSFEGGCTQWFGGGLECGCMEGGRGEPVPMVEVC